MEQDQQYSYARIVPISTTARTRFADAVRKAQKDDAFQLRFYVNETLHIDAVAPESPLDPDNAIALLSLASSKLPQWPTVGWRVGRGSHNIDISIATAESDSQGRPSRFLVSVHPRSGILMLRAGPISTASLSYADEEQNIVHLQPEHKVALYQPITRVFIGNYELQIQYNVPRRERESFFNELDRFLEERYCTRLYNNGRCFPGAGLQNRQGKFLLGEVIGSGTYGDISYGINIETGDPIAMKDIRLQNSGWREEILREIELQEALHDSPYTLSLLACWCSGHRKHPRLCPGQPHEHVQLFTEIGMFDFKNKRLREQSFPKILELFRQTLLGIRDLKSRGIMHRDITLANMLVQSLDPPKAVLIDFGKAVRSEKGSSTCLGPIASCAPEVWAGKEYTNTIDLWAWAYAVAEFCGYSTSRRNKVAKITPSRLGEILLSLDNAVSARSELKGLVSLLTKILVWNVETRIDVEEALQHEIWKDACTTDDILNDDVESPKNPTKKRRTDLESSTRGTSSESEEL